MASIEEFMARHHKACDARFAAAEAAAGEGDWPAVEREFGAFERDMAHHFEMEEAVLFPAFEERTGMDGGPTYVMREEHDQMRQILAAMKAAAGARDADEYLGQADTLNVLMQQHNIKEEQVLYRMMDQHLGGETDMLLARFEEVGAV